MTAFRDIQPHAPTHILVVPNRVIPTLADVSADDEAVLGRMLRVAADLAADEGVARTGYRVMINCRDHGGQEVYHLHLHLHGRASVGSRWSDAVADFGSPWSRTSSGFAVRVAQCVATSVPLAASAHTFPRLLGHPNPAPRSTASSHSRSPIPGESLHPDRGATGRLAPDPQAGHHDVQPPPHHRPPRRRALRHAHPGQPRLGRPHRPPQPQPRRSRRQRHRARTL